MSAAQMSEWERRVRSGTRGMSEAQIAATIAMCEQSERDNGHGLGVCVWHAASIVCGSVCHCAPCTAVRAALAKVAP
jgi:hypothetical protein